MSAAIGRGCVFFILIAVAHAIAAESGRVGDVEFFGYRGLDVEKIRRSLPVREGDKYSDGLRSLVRKAVLDAIGKEPTDVAAICCDGKGRRLLFIGLPGRSYKKFVYNPEPNGNERLSPEIFPLYDRLDHALEAAVTKGDGAAEEDDSNGYALVKDPTARALELAVREWAMDHDRELLDVLRSSSSVAHRRIASDALGYARQSAEQVSALVDAARDPDGEVRNNATRALVVLARSQPSLVDKIPADIFVLMLNSGLWTDRNKGTSLLAELTRSRKPELLGKVRSEAFDSLVEMAWWNEPSHALFARIILGRLGGIPEPRLQKLAWDGPVEQIVNAAKQ